jgi:tetratricopeptide (TPR) repeat protein
MISPGSLVRGYNWMDTLSHEYTHYILTKKSRNNLPLWMHEGIAKYFETRWRDNYVYLTPIMETMLAGGLQKNYLISLDDMMPSLAKLKTAEDVQLAYAEVSTMIEYLTQVHGDEVISTLLEKLAKEESFDLAMSDTIGINLDTFQKEWKNFVKQKKLKTIPGLKPPGVHFKADRLFGEPSKEYREIDDRKSRDLTFLGDILQSRNFYKAALIEYQRAIDQSKVFSPILHNKLAKTYLITKKYNKAEVILNRSLNYYPMFHSTLATMGELYFNTGDTKRSRDFYERAIHVNPFNPLVHMRLMTIYQKLEWKKEKKLQTKLFGYIDH